MKVLRVLTRPNGGGPVRHLGALERELGRLGVESLFLVGRCRNGEVDRIGDLEAAGASPVRIRALRPSLSPADVAAAARAIAARIRAFDPDLIHSHTAVAGAAARLAAPAGLPVVHTFHGHTLRGGYWGAVGGLLVQQSERWLARRTDVIVTVARRVEQELREAGLRPRRGWALLPPAPDPFPVGPPRAVARAGLGLDPDSAVILFAGRLERVKGLDLLLDSMRAAPAGSRLAHALLLVCGAGRDREQLEQEARPLAGRVRFLGWREDLAVPLAAADLAALPSRNEGWPLLLAETAAAGIPVVAADVGGCAEALERFGHGLLVAPEDAAALARRLEELLQDPARREALGEQGMRRAREGWQPPEAAARHLALYEALRSGADGPWTA